MIQDKGPRAGKGNQPKPKPPLSHNDRPAKMADNTGDEGAWYKGCPVCGAWKGQPMNPNLWWAEACMAGEALKGDQ